MNLLSQLKSFQRREWLFRFLAGASRWLALVLIVLATACTVDWFLDRERDTPMLVRAILTLTLLATATLGAYLFLFRLRVPALDSLAEKAEAAIPEFGHRLVTALQLNRPGARIEGMSRSLLSQVTQEAETLSARHHLAVLADSAPVKSGLRVLAPILLIVLGLAAWKFELVSALVARQFLLPVEIPHSVNLTNITPKVWPSGDAVELKVEVTGPVSETDTGYVVVYPVGQPSEQFPLTYAGRLTAEKALFVAQLPPSGADFTFRARLVDGRLRQDGSVHFVPRPVVLDPEAFVILPRYVDPEGKREYRRQQSQGEVVALLDSEVEVRANVSKPITTARLVLFGRDGEGKETIVGREEMTISDQGKAISHRFRLPAKPTAYRLEVADEHGFANLHPPRRGISVAPDQPPQVRLLRETMWRPGEEGNIEDHLVDWMQLTLGGKIMVKYEATSPLGLSRAFIVYRVRSNEDWSPWIPLPLTRTVADLEKVGEFVPEIGLFTKSNENSQVEFYQIPSPDPAMVPPGLQAGGHINFQTAALRKPKIVDGRSMQVPLEIGDIVEIRVVVYDRNPAPALPPTQPPYEEGLSSSTLDEAKPKVQDDRRVPGWSQSMFKRVITQAEFNADLQRYFDQLVRLRELEEKQRSVFRLPLREKP